MKVILILGLVLFFLIYSGLKERNLKFKEKLDKHKKIKHTMNLITNGFLIFFLIFSKQIFMWAFDNHENTYKEQYLNTYLSQQQQVKVMVSEKYFEEQFDYTSYFKGSIFYQGIFGGSRDFIFIDTYSNKYFRIMRFDEYKKKAGSQQTYEIKEEELYVMVDSVQYKDPTYGTLEKPYVVFSYKAVNKKLMMTINNWDKKDERGYYVKEEVPLAPSEKEYRYNAEQYLTYVMPKKEFKQRFCK